MKDIKKLEKEIGHKVNVTLEIPKTKMLTQEIENQSLKEIKEKIQ